MNLETPDSLLSIIVTTGSVDDDLTLSLSSCIHQSYEHIEIIVVHHGHEKCDVLVTDERMTLYHLLDQTISEARNFGIQKATGEVLTFLESGQELHEGWLEKAKERFHISKADAIQCGTMYEKDNKIEKLAIADDSIFGFYQRLLIKNTIPINAIIVKREICSLFPKEKNLIGEWEFWINTLRGKKVDVQGEYFGSIIHLIEPLDTLNSAEYEKERLEIMEAYFKEISFSPKKLKQLIAIKQLRKKLMA